MRIPSCRGPRLQSLLLVVVALAAATTVVRAQPFCGGFPTYPFDDPPGSMAVATGAAALVYSGGPAGFGSPRTVPLGGSRDSVSILTADVDGDGAPDLLSVNGCSQSIIGDVTILRGKGDGAFFPAESVSTGSCPIAAAFGDVDEDGIGDLVIGKSIRGVANVVFLPGTGNGRFGRPLPAALVPLPKAVRLGDLDGDGHLDVVTAGSGGVALLAGLGDGTFRPPRIVNLPAAGAAPALVDVNEDGALDVVLATFPDVAILLGDGFGGVAGVASVAAGYPSAVLALDADGDAHADLVTVHDTEDVFSLHSGDGTGRFAAPRTHDALDKPTSIAVADFDGDGALDAALANANDLCVSLHRGDGGGGFATSGPRFTMGSFPDDVLAIDWNGDAVPDVVTANRGSQLATVRSGDGLGGFLPPRHHGPLDGAVAVAAGDFDEDGRLDLAFARDEIEAVALLFGDGNGGVASTSAAPLAGETASSLAAADVTGDGHLDICAIKWSGNGVVLVGDGAGGFEPRGPGFDWGGPAPVALADLDGDGALDWILPNSSEGDDVVVGLNDGTGFFFFDRSFTITIRPRAIAIADFDADGFLDLALAGPPKAAFPPIRDTAGLLFGDGTGSFGGWRALETGHSPSDIAAGDFDSDGLLDCLVVHELGGDAVTLLGDGAGGLTLAGRRGIPKRPESAATADFDGDGDLDAVVACVSGGDFELFENCTTSALLAPGDARRGNVNGGAGPTADVLFVNESSGGERREVILDRHTALRVDVVAPPSASGRRARFALYGWDREPGSSRGKVLPFGLGVTCLPTPLSGGEPQPRWIWNNFDAKRTGLGVPTRDSRPAPSTVVLRSRGLDSPGQMVLQGLIADRGAPNGRAAVTNGIRVEVR